MISVFSAHCDAVFSYFDPVLGHHHPVSENSEILSLFFLLVDSVKIPGHCFIL